MISNTLACKFCNKVFATPYNLKVHIDTAKYCISKRPKFTIPVNKFKCEHCDNTFAQNSHLKSHYLSCKIRRDVMIEQKIEKVAEDYEKEIDKLKEELEREKDTNYELEIIVEQSNDRIRELELELSHSKGQIVGLKTAKPSKTKNTINNYINPKLANIPTEGMPYLTKNYIQEFVNEGLFTYDLFMQGPSGIAKFLGDCVTITDGECDEPRKNYLCTDSSRHKYHKYENTGWKLDVDAKFLSIVCEEIKQITNEYLKELSDKCINEPDELKRQMLDDTRVNLINPMMLGINSKKGIKRDKLISDVRLHLKPLISI